MRNVEFWDINVEGTGQYGIVEEDFDLALLASLKTVNGEDLISHWLDPVASLAKADGTRETVRDAATEQIYQQGTSSVAPVRSFALNGQPTLEIDSAKVCTYFPLSNAVQLPPDQWSLLSVFETPAESTESMAFVSKGDNVAVAPGMLWPSLRLTRFTDGTDRLLVAEVGTSNVRVGSSFRNDLRGRRIMALATFSVDRGFRLYMNGAVIGENASDVRPLTHPSVGFLGNTVGGNAPAHGKFGWQMAFRGDLSASVYAGALDVVHQVCARRYGIL
jgi:hypothetical protein